MKHTKTQSMNDLLQKIELVRNRMNHLSSHTTLSSSEILSLSAQLDKLLNEYEWKQKNQK
ncbi:Spo0E family sporulation regulatory protein-aspartic acid phosphatase [Salipaludibacillus sp. HK11]|uniref:Spo0E family sporulation regulatory protein-aspartic acid phosphatase n=1 Tax=Salipaludibacillus sp. HK11 TaxID=3394320 RepID=UPI0039FBF043